MLRWKRSRNKSPDEPGEHSVPTEPLFPPVGTAVPDGEAIPTEEVLPTPLLYDPSLSQQQGPSSPSAAAYPVLPPLPTIQQDRRPAGSIAPIQPASAQKPTELAQSRRSTIPVFVGVFFVAVQFLLLISFVARLISLSPQQQWLSVLYGICNIFLLPFHLLFQRISLPFSLTVGVEVYTLLAILVYGILSRLLVHLLKLLFRSR